MMSSEFYKSIHGADKFLLMQWDTYIVQENCMQKFLKFDYIGAAWSFQEYYGNGGLSLRSKAHML